MPERRRASPPIRVGVDVVEVDRVRRLVAENDGLLDAVFSPGERLACLGRRRCYEHLAARFAAKEAVLKALGTGVASRMLWSDVEVVEPPTGRAHVRLHGEVAAFAARQGVGSIDVSLAAARSVAMAQAVATWDGRGEEWRAVPSD